MCFVQCFGQYCPSNPFNDNHWKSILHVAETQASQMSASNTYQSWTLIRGFISCCPWFFNSCLTFGLSLGDTSCQISPVTNKTSAKQFWRSELQVAVSTPPNSTVQKQLLSVSEISPAMSPLWPGWLSLQNGVSPKARFSCGYPVALHWCFVCAVGALGCFLLPSPLLLLSEKI